jgi:hypothetical protein
LFACLVLVLLAVPALAQDENTVPYTWEEAGLALAYPAGWEQPAPDMRDGMLILRLAQILAAQPEVRPAGAPAITLTLTEAADVDPTAALIAALNTQATPAASDLTEALVTGAVGVTATGESADGLLFGIGRAARLDDGRLLVVTGRTLAQNRNAFVRLFERVVEKLVPADEAADTAPRYGVVWFTGSAEDMALPDLTGLVYAGGRLYALDAALGVLELDARTGAVLATLPAERWEALAANEPAPPDLETFAYNFPPPLVNDATVDAEGNLILATEEQGVLLVSPQGDLLGSVGRVVPTAPLPGEFVNPQAVAVDEAGTVYVADSDGSSGAITALSTAVTPERIGASALVLDTAVQGLLTEAAPQQAWTYDAEAGATLTFSAIDATLSGVLDVGLRVLAPDGTEIAFNDDQPGTDLFNPTDAQMTLTTASAGTHTVIVERVNGEGVYALGVSQPQAFDLREDGVTRLDGALDDVFPSQRWTFTGEAGTTLTVTMQSPTGLLDPLLRLYDAEGALLAENDDADDPELGVNAQLTSVRLPADGVYTLEAARFEGTGEYELIVVETS